MTITTKHSTDAILRSSYELSSDQNISFTSTVAHLLVLWYRTKSVGGPLDTPDDWYFVSLKSNFTISCYYGLEMSVKKSEEIY